MLGKEVGEQCPALGIEHASNDFRTMVEATIAHDIPERSDRASLGVEGAEHHAIDSREHGRTRAHRAWFKRDDEAASIKPPLTPGLCGFAQCHNFCMRRGIAIGFTPIATATDDRSVSVDDNSADRNVCGE